MLLLLNWLLLLLNRLLLSPYTRLQPTCLMGSCSLRRSELERQRLCPHLDPGIMVLGPLSHLFLVGAGAAPEQGADAQGVVLGRDDLLATHAMHAGQVLLVHDILFDALAGRQLVGGLQPREAEHAVRLIVRNAQLDLLAAGRTAGRPRGNGQLLLLVIRLLLANGRHCTAVYSNRRLCGHGQRLFRQGDTVGHIITAG